MIFTSRLRKAALVFLASSLGLSGCATLESDSAQQDATGDAQEEGYTPTADPYLNQKPPVPNQARGLFQGAIEAMQAQQWQQARDLLQRMTQSYPDLSGPYVNLGLVHRAMGELELAAESFEKAIKVNPLNGEAYNQLAILHREQGEFEQAEKRYQQVLDVWPDNQVAHRNLGILYDLYMGRLSEALEHYRLAQKIAQEPDRRLEGWIVDLERRLEQQQAAN